MKNNQLHDAPAPKNGGRVGQFMWMDDDDKNRYLAELRNKITRGYYFSEKVIGRIVEDLSPVFADTMSHENG